MTTNQQKVINDIKDRHDTVASKLEEIEKNIESLNNMDVPENIKEYCCKGIYISLEETSLEKKKLADEYSVESQKLPKEDIENVYEIIYETIQELNKARVTLEEIYSQHVNLN
jgi:Mg2+ and Co2+ transporter CorA